MQISETEIDFTAMTPERRRRILDGREPFDFRPSEPLIDARVVSRFQPIASLRAAVEAMPAVLHDVGPVEVYGPKTYLDIDLEDGTVRLSSDQDEEADRTRNKGGFTRCYEVFTGTPGHRFIEVLDVAAREMPAVVAGFSSDDYGMCGGLTTDESFMAFLRVRDALCALNDEMEEA